MPMEVVTADAAGKPLTKLNPDGRGATVVIQAESPEPLLALQARELAIKTAGELGLAGCGISSQSGTYPVDAEGNTSDDVYRGKTPVAGYRQEFSLLRGL